MFANRNCFSRWLSLSVLVFIAGLLVGRAQDTSLEDIKYKEDYDRIQKIAAVKLPTKRADQFISLFKERTDLDPKLQFYADGLFLKDLETLNKQRNLVAMRGLCERAIKVRPQWGEVYLHYGFALKQDQKMEEAIKAFAKCFLIKNQFQQRAKQQLDLAYRTKNGSLVGEDKLLEAVKKEVK